MEAENHIDRIEAYLSGILSQDEKVVFEKELETNPEWHQLFIEHKYFLDGIAGMKTDAFAEKMRNDNISSLNPAKRRKPILNPYISIAASILLLIGISYLMLQPPGMQRLAKDNYVAPFPQIQRSKVPAGDSLFYAGMAAFGRKDWKDAISTFNQIEVSHPMHQRILYYMAHAFTGQGQYEKAIALFNNPVLKEGQYAQQTEWNNVLMRMFLKHPKEEIIKDLVAIANNDEQFYHDQAKEVLKQLGEKDFKE